MVIDTNNINSSGGANRSRSSTPVVAAPSTKTPSAPTSPVETAEKGSKDNVVLSSEAQNLVRLQAKINSLPDVNMDRVAAIKQAIAEGRFEINPERIAENILKQDELLG
jgi:negative regulator of flagellin synthesis FlgM